MNKKHFADPAAVFLNIFIIVLAAVCSVALFFIFQEYIASTTLGLALLFLVIAVAILSLFSLLIASRKVLIDEVGIHIFCRNSEKLLEWESICKVEATFGGRNSVNAHFFVHTEIGLEITALEITTYLLRSVKQYAPARIKETLASELSHFKITF